VSRAKLNNSSLLQPGNHDVSFNDIKIGDHIVSARRSFDEGADDENEDEYEDDNYNIHEDNEA